MSTPFCADCPDHEACMTGYPCAVVKNVAAGQDQRDNQHAQHPVPASVQGLGATQGTDGHIGTGEGAGGAESADVDSLAMVLLAENGDPGYTEEDFLDPAQAALDWVRTTLRADGAAGDALRARLSEVLTQAHGNGARGAMEATTRAWQCVGWAEVLLPPAPGPMGTAQAVTEWLRARTEALR